VSVIDASRKLVSELSGMIDKKVKVILSDGRHYEGVLIGFDHPSLNLLIQNAVDNNGVKYPKVVIKGDRVSEILISEIPLFDPEEFKDFLLHEMKIAEHLVRVIPEARIIEVQGRYRVSEKGVEGVGPMAETLYSLWKKYIAVKEKAVKG